MYLKKSIVFPIALIIGILITLSCKKEDDAISPDDVEKWSYYDIDNGLPSNQINCLTEDSLHNIWIGTNKGLAKFDGNGFTYYSRKNGLPSDSVYAVYYSKRNEVYVGTYNGFGKVTSTGEYIKIIHVKDLKCNNFTEDVGSACVFCSVNIGLIGYYYEISSLQYVTIDSTLVQGRYLPNPVNHVLCDNKKNVWTATPKGIYCFSFPGKKFFSNYDLGLTNVRRLNQDKAGNIWIISSEGEKVAYYDGLKFIDNWIFAGYNNYKAFIQDKYNNYWISIAGHGVLNYAGGMGKVYNTANSRIISNDINDILYDSKGNLWFGSNDKGLINFQNLKPLEFEFDPGYNSKPANNPIY